ncbi:Panacea domain-containing protein [Hungatella hathewayi]|uniref:Panacea domain-containing protein n=1 Tax=Hungatella hathewayi TaxID=154046 RepID=UPI003569DBAF
MEKEIETISNYLQTALHNAKKANNVELELRLLKALKGFHEEIKDGVQLFKNKPLSANFIASYIINYSFDQGFPVTNLKLQFLLYYIQANSLVMRNRRFYDEDILKYRFGPAVKSVYNTYRKFVDKEIERQNFTEIIEVVDGYLKKVHKVNSYDDYSEEDKQLMNQIIQKYKDLSDWQISDLVKQDQPWKQAKEYLDVICDNWIIEYFKSGNTGERNNNI